LVIAVPPIFAVIKHFALFAPGLQPPAILRLKNEFVANPGKIAFDAVAKIFHILNIKEIHYFSVISAD
jgi:hypothetical protein